MAIREEKWKGGSTVAVLTEDARLSTRSRVKIVEPDAPNRRMILPQANLRPLSPGGPVFYLVNRGSWDVYVDNVAGTQLHVLEAGKACVVLLVYAGGQVGEWAFLCLDFDTDSGATLTTTTEATTSSTTTTTTTTTSTTTPKSTPRSTRDPGGGGGGGGGGTGGAQSEVEGDGEPWWGQEVGPTTRFVISLSPSLGLKAREPSKLLNWPCDPDHPEPWEVYGPTPETREPLTPKVSVIVTCLNEGDDLERTVRSFLHADDLPHEIILVDDSSRLSPRSRFEKVCAEAGEWSGGVFLRNRDRVGVAPSRQRGIDAATGDFVLVVDSHVLVPRDWMRKSAAHLAANPDDVFTPISAGFDDAGMWVCGTSLRLNVATGTWKAEWQQTRTDVASPVVGGCMGACYLVSKRTLSKLGGWGPGLRGWGLDEEYLCARAWSAGVKVRGMTDWAAKHNYDRGKIDRKPRSGDADQRWEVLYNNCVVAIVTLGQSAWNRTYRSAVLDAYPDPGMVRTVLQKLRENASKIREARATFKRNVTRTVPEVAALLCRVSNEATNSEVQPVLTTHSTTQAARRAG